MNENEIIKAIQSGERERFGELYDIWAKKIYRFLYYKTSHKETSQDLMSEVFFKALKKIDDYQITENSFGAWLYAIARNSLIDYYRRHRATENIEWHEDIFSDEDLVQKIQASIDLEKLQNAMSTLDPEMRELIILRLWEGLSYKEIAQIMKKNESTLRQNFHRGILKLRETIIFLLILTLINI